jgi:hypothetical protein
MGEKPRGLQSSAADILRRYCFVILIMVCRGRPRLESFCRDAAKLVEHCAGRLAAMVHPFRRLGISPSTQPENAADHYCGSSISGGTNGQSFAPTTNSGFGVVVVVDDVGSGAIRGINNSRHTASSISHIAPRLSSLENRMRTWRFILKKESKRRLLVVSYLVTFLVEEGDDEEKLEEAPDGPSCQLFTDG